MEQKKGGFIFFLSISLIVVLVVFYTFSGEENNKSYVEKIEKFREEKDEMFREGGGSPLPRTEKVGFEGLRYFPINEAYRVVADYELLPIPEKISLPTSTGDQRDFIKYAVAKFQLDNKPRVLTILKQTGRMGNLTKDEVLFLAFTDGTTGNSTYEAGRYLNISPEGSTVVLDFNMAYNPYCNYNSTYECPIPLRENHLDMPIEAGEMKYPSEE